MNGFKVFANTPFSDLWLPVVLCGLILISILALHWLWLNWRTQRLEKRLQAASAAHTANTPNSLRDRQSAATESSLPGERSAALGRQLAPAHPALSDLQALTAQKHPVTLEERIHIESAYVPSTLIEPERLDPTFDPDFEHDVDAAHNGLAHVYHASAGTATPAPAQRSEPASHPRVTAEVVAAAQDEDEAVFFKPHSTMLQAKPAEPAAPTLHEVFHYQARLTWSDVHGKQVLAEALRTTPWLHTLPLVCVPDAQDECSVIVAWQVASRRELAKPQDALDFKHWCDTLATMSAGRCELLSLTPWDSFIDEAHALLIALDSVIVLKVVVPLVQLDLFAQSLIAARFSQVQEHWCYQEQADGVAVYLERLWQQGSADSGAASQQAVFQMMIDIPHLDALEARKIYMRLRAVARTSAAIVQSAQGVHLSEGMLDRYSRELMLKQDALAQAKVPAGSALAHALYKPQLRLSQDLELG